jgi:ribosomal protein S18 acetylase RimI-like enzyme
VVGQRVVVRRVLPGRQGPSGGPAMTDLLGVCTAWGGGTCVVQPETGPPVTIALADIVSGKPVPPRPSVRLRVSARDAEMHVASLFEEMDAEPLGEWVLRAAPPYGGRMRRRANSVLAMGDPGVPLAGAVAAVRGFYAARDRPPLAQVEAGSDVDGALVAAGWVPLETGATAYLVGSVGRVLRSCNAELSRLGPPHTRLPDGITPRYMEEGARLTLEQVAPDGAVVATGVAALDGDWVGLHSLHVQEELRGAGAGTALLGELLDWAASRGATTAWLHVELDNPRARALYERLGFAEHHASRYLAENPERHGRAPA